MPSLAELSDRLWKGLDSTKQQEHHPFASLDVIEEVASGVVFYKSFVNMTAVRTDDGLVLIDTGSFLRAQHEQSHRAVRSWSDDRLHTAVYTHGHVDHAYGLPPFLRELEDKGWSPPDIVGHRGVGPRMQRYVETAGYNEVINERQFGMPVKWPIRPDRPTITYEDRLDLSVGGCELRLEHCRGETDDHTWVFLPESRVLCTGDLFIWAAPNAGNPQKVQRYAIDWARGLRRMAALEPEVLCPGHGLPILGADRVQEALVDTASYLESLYGQTLQGMNDGASVYDLIETVKPPPALAEKPYLCAVYDEPEFIVRNVHRHLGGWYSGVPSELKPAPRAELARELAVLSGGIGRLLSRANECLKDGNLPIACHLIDLAVEAQPDSLDVHRLRAEIYQKRLSEESSTMSRGIFGAAARESQAKVDR